MICKADTILPRHAHAFTDEEPDIEMSGTTDEHIPALEFPT